MPWDEEYELVVLGAAAGGMTAALVASIEGLRTLLIEKGDQVCGTTAYSWGTVWIPNNSQQRQLRCRGGPYLPGCLGGGPRDGSTAVYPHIVLARSARGEGQRVEKPAVLAGQLEAALASNRPTVLEVRVAPDVRPLATRSWDLPPLPPPIPNFGWEED